METLAARGIREDASLSLDATITPHALGARTPPFDAPPPPLPRISLSLPGETVGTSPQSDRELEVVALLGEGGMGSVYLAKQRSLARSTAKGRSLGSLRRLESGRAGSASNLPNAVGHRASWSGKHMALPTGR